EDGRFELLGVAPGEHRVEVTATDGERAPEERTVTVSGSDVDLGDIASLAKKTIAPLRGRVVDGEGRPIAGALVTLATHLPRIEGFERPEKLETKTDAEGRFAFDELEALFDNDTF